ncbi:MAG: response regulator transcription factor [Steroidobacteraceae bacterium]
MSDRRPILYVLDDDSAVRDSLLNLFGSVGLRAKCFGTAQAFLRHSRPDCASCLLLDVRLPGLSGIELQRELNARGDRLPIIFMTAFGDIPMAVSAIKAGADEFLTKPFREQELLEAVGRALERDTLARAERAELLTLHGRWKRLTAKEREVMSRVVAGKSNKQIAADFARSEFTIKAHRRHIMEKMSATSLTVLVRMADRLAKFEEHVQAPRRAIG